MTFYHKTVRYNLSKIEVDSYRPTKKGINCTFGDYDFKNNEVTVFYSCSDNPLLAPEERRTMEDIEEEISRLEPRIVRESHCDLNLPFKYAMKFILDHHALDRQFDHLRSKAVMVNQVRIPKFELKEVNRYYEKQGIKALDENQEIFTEGEVIFR